MSEHRYPVGQRVSREIDLLRPYLGEKTGTIAMCYSQGRGRWHDPEVYEVQWDDGSKDRGYFRHGLTAIS